MKANIKYNMAPHYLLYLGSDPLKACFVLGFEQFLHVYVYFHFVSKLQIQWMTSHLYSCLPWKPAHNGTEKLHLEMKKS